MDSRRAVGVVYAVIFTDLLAFSLVIPSLPAVVVDRGGGGLALGLLFTSYSLAQFVAAPILGRLSDRVGRRPLVLLALVGSSASLVLAGFSSSLWLLLLARVVGGLCGGSIGVAHAFLSDLTTRDQRTRVMGLAGASIGVAFTVGPALGAILAPFGFTVVCLVGAAVAALNLLAARLWLPAPTAPSTAPSQVHEAAPAHEAPHTHEPTDAPEASHGPEDRAPDDTGRRRSAVLVTVLCATGLSMVAFVSMETTLGLLVDDRFGFGPVALGWIIALNGLVLVVVQGGLVGPLAGRFGDWRVAVAGAAVMSVSLLLLPDERFAVFIGALCLVGAGQGLLTTTVSSIVSKTGPPETVGARLGANQAVSALGRATGPVIGGILYDVGATLPFVVTGVLVGAVAVGLLADALRTTAPRVGPTSHGRQEHHEGNRSNA